MKLSVLDQSAVVSGRQPDASIRESLALARHADALGYHRYWLAEHHNSAAIAGSAPEIMIAAIAATTRHIRVGSAGVMLPHYASLKVAEQFRVLAKKKKPPNWAYRAKMRRPNRTASGLCRSRFPIGECLPPPNVHWRY